MVLSFCPVKHRCPEGDEGECSQIQGHLGKHLCKKCLSFFSSPEARRPERPQPAASVSQAAGTGAGRGDAVADSNLPPMQPASQVFARMKQSQPVREAEQARPGQFQLSGIWNSQVQTQYGVMKTELILDDAKKFSQQAFLGYLMTYDVGTYQTGDGYIHFVVQDHEPKMYNGEKMTWIASWTYFYTVEDDNTMVFEDRIAHSRWTVKRGSWE
jgi:hypothetical protein